ncbi:MAG: hypothetical protein WCO00_04405 [Rhodospirillaceae bacterium]
MIKTRVLAAILASLLIAPGAAPASTMPAFTRLTALTAAQPPAKQCLPARCPVRVAEDDSVVVPDSCDAAAQSQCRYDCQILRTDCETGHDDSLPCEANYTTCASNCGVMAGCSN